jgi:hypothetical protein
MVQRDDRDGRYHQAHKSKQDAKNSFSTAMLVRRRSGVSHRGTA